MEVSINSKMFRSTTATGVSFDFVFISRYRIHCSTKVCKRFPRNLWFNRRRDDDVQKAPNFVYRDLQRQSPVGATWVRGENWKRGNRQKKLRYKNFSAWGIQPGPFAAFGAIICSDNFQIFPLLYWEANSYYPTEGKGENGKFEISETAWKKGSQIQFRYRFPLGHSNWIICSLLSRFGSHNFPIFSL